MKPLERPSPPLILFPTDGQQQIPATLSSPRRGTSAAIAGLPSFRFSRGEIDVVGAAASAIHDNFLAEENARIKAQLAEAMSEVSTLKAQLAASLQGNFLPPAHFLPALFYTTHRHVIDAMMTYALLYRDAVALLDERCRAPVNQERESDETAYCSSKELAAQVRRSRARRTS